MTTKDRSKMELSDLREEAEKRKIDVLRLDGAPGAPKKDDYLRALEEADGKRGDEHAHGNEPPGLSTPAPAIPGARGKPLAGAGDRTTLDDEETEEEQEEREEEEAKRTVRVRALRAGQYPANVLRDKGNEFNYLMPEDHDELPSWMEAIDEDEGEYKTRDLPSSQTPGEARRRSSETDEDTAEGDAVTVRRKRPAAKKSTKKSKR